MKKNLIWIILLIVFSIILLISLYLFFVMEKKEIVNTDVKYYSEKINKILKKDNDYDLVIEKPYSKTLDVVISNDLYNRKYLNEYLIIKYVEKDNFIDEINKLLEKKYNGNEINNIYSKVKENSINIILNNNKIDLSMLDVSNFDENNLARYIEYSKNNNYEINNIVTYVNIGLDYEFYSVSKEIEDPQEIDVLLNKYNYLPKDYVPSDLVSLSGSMQIKREVKEKVDELISDAKKDGISFGIYSAYRSYTRQITTYNKYVTRDGKEVADTFSARPGFSEHQTGLTIDLSGSNGRTVKDNTDEYNWLSANAHKYGFIIRYPKDKTYITGYVFEPWHIRYLGNSLATKVYESKLTYDEYYDIYIKER